MSRELLQAIRHLQGQKPAEPNLRNEAVGSEALLDQLREGLSAEIQQRIQRTVQRFSRALDDLGASAPGPKAEPSLKDTQEIIFCEVNGASTQRSPRPDTSGSSTANRELQRLHRELSELPDKVAAAVTSVTSISAGPPAEADGDAPGSSELLQSIVQKLGTLEDVARRLEDRLDEQATSTATTPATGPAWAEFEGRLTAAFADLLAEHRPTESIGREEIRELIAEHLSSPAAQLAGTREESPRGWGPEFDAKIDAALERASALAAESMQQRLGSIQTAFEQLGERLQQIESAVSQNVDSTTSAPRPLTERLDQMEEKVIAALAIKHLDSQDDTHALDLTPLVNRLAALESGVHALAASPPKAHDGQPSAQVDERLEAWLERAGSLPTNVESLRKDLSMLVHAVNAHMEQGIEKSDAILEQIRLGAGSDSTRHEGSAEALHEALARLEELAELPSRVSEDLRRTLDGWTPTSAAEGTPSGGVDPTDWVERIESAVERVAELTELPERYEAQWTRWRDELREALGESNSTSKPGKTQAGRQESVDIGELRNLPAQVNEVLLAVGEAHHHGLTSMVQDSVDQLVARLESLLKKRS